MPPQPWSRRTAAAVYSGGRTGYAAVRGYIRRPHPHLLIRTSLACGCVWRRESGGKVLRPSAGRVYVNRKDARCEPYGEISIAKRPYFREVECASRISEGRFAYFEQTAPPRYARAPRLTKAGNGPLCLQTNHYIAANGLRPCYNLCRYFFLKVRKSRLQL